MIPLYLAFIGGELLHVLKRADLTGQSKANKLTLQSYLAGQWSVILIRGIIGLGLFAIWLSTPDLFTKLGMSIPFSLPATKAVAFFLGYFADSGIDHAAQKFPWAGREVPSEH